MISKLLLYAGCALIAAPAVWSLWWLWRRSWRVQFRIAPEVRVNFPRRGRYAILQVLWRFPEPRIRRREAPTLRLEGPSGEERSVALAHLSHSQALQRYQQLWILEVEHSGPHILRWSDLDFALHLHPMLRVSLTTGWRGWAALAVAGVGVFLLCLSVWAR